MIILILPVNQENTTPSVTETMASDSSSLEEKIVQVCGECHENISNEVSGTSSSK